MKKQIVPHLLTVILLGCLLFRASAQEGIGIGPYSFTKNFQQKYGARALTLLELSTPDLSPILEEDRRLGWPRVAIEIPVHIDMNWSGEWLGLPNGDRLWRYTIRAKGAQGLTLSYAEFKLPAEGLLHIYNKDKTQVLGAFSSFNNSDGGRFATAMVDGDELTLEYYEPSFCRGQAKLVADAVGYAYRSVAAERSGIAVDSSYINCPSGAAWQQQKRGSLVILMKFDNTNGLFWCNGALMNNTAKDLTPYVLTSHDFLLGPYYIYGSEPVYEEFVFYFNWEYRNCGGPAFSPDLATMTGCSLIARNQNTAMLLLKINGAIPVTPHKPYYLGYDRSTDVPASPVCIHTPATSFKQIALTDMPVTTPQNPVQSSATGITYPGNNFFKVIWTSGNTKNGSEGSPLMNQGGNVVGFNFSSGGGCNGNEAHYVRFSEMWSPANTQDSEKLAPWLDSLGYDLTALDGVDGGCNNFSGPVEQLDRAVLGKLSGFISRELHGNYKILEQAYIGHRREIDLALTSNDPKYRDVQAALETVKEKGIRTYFRAFIFEKENVVTAEDLAAWRHFIQELEKVVGSASFTNDMQQISRLLEVVTDKDLKTALIAFDRASLNETGVAGAQSPPHQLRTALTGNPGLVTTLQYELPENGAVEIALTDLNSALRRTLLTGFAEKGSYSLVIEKQELPPGFYFVRCVFTGSSGRLQSVQKLLIQ